MASDALANRGTGAQDHITEADLWLDKLPEDLKSVKKFPAVAEKV